MPTLSRRDLEILECLDAHASLTAIARELDVSQPLVSSRRAALERSLGRPLIARKASGFTPEPPAFALARSARHALLALDAADDAFAAAAAGAAGAKGTRVHIAASLTIAERLLPAWLSTLGREPNISVDVMNSARVHAAISSGAAEIGFIEGAFDPPGVTTWPITRDELVLIATPHAAAAHVLSGDAALTAARLIELPLVLREEGSGTREVLAEACLCEGTYLPSQLPEVSSAAAILRAVAHGSLAVVPRLAIAAELAAGTFVEIPTTLRLGRELRMITGEGARLSATARRLARIVRSER